MIFLVRRVFVRTNNLFDNTDVDFGYVEAPSLKDALEKLDLVKLGREDTDQHELYFAENSTEMIRDLFTKNVSCLVVGYYIFSPKELTKEDVAYK